MIGVNDCSGKSFFSENTKILDCNPRPEGAHPIETIIFLFWRCLGSGLSPQVLAPPRAFRYNHSHKFLKQTQLHIIGFIIKVCAIKFKT